MFGFIRWWWRKRDNSERMLVVVFGWVVLALCLMPFIGIQSLGVLFGGIFSSIVLVLIYHMIQALREQIGRYQKELDRERQYIVDKLAGRRS